jgi:thymidylate synthase
LDHLEPGDLGPIYGFQWRHFNADYNGCNEDYENKGIDQLKEVIDQLKNPETRNSRRLVITAWNPCQLDNMALPPCHILFQFNVIDNNKLSCSMYQRSVDVPLGCPFNIASYSFLTHLIAHQCDLEPYEFVYYMGNAHIYEQHLDSMKLQVERDPYKFPQIKILNKRNNLEDYILEDFEILNYTHNTQIKMNMIT